MKTFTLVMQGTPTPTPQSIGAAPAAHDQAWSTITSRPTTLAGYGITDAATATHVHSADKSVITLTPLNSFAVLAGWDNSLTIFPAIKQAVLAFGLSRATVPGAIIEVFSWNIAYTAGALVRFCPNKVQLVGGSEGGSFFYVADNKLFWNPSGVSGTAVDVAIGGLVFSYA